MSAIDYKPPPTIRDFITDYRKGELFYDFIVGPLGSGKTTGLFFKLVYMAALQEPSPVDGVRRTRAVIVRNTNPQLKDTTMKSWDYWFKEPTAGTFKASTSTFVLKFADERGPIECEVLFRPLDTPDDVARVLSLELSFAILDEFVEIPRQIVDALSGRLGRYPPKKDGGCTNWGLWASSNPSIETNWWFKYLHEDLPENARYFVQPSGLSPEAENLDNLPGGAGYYLNQAKGKSDEWVRQYLCCEWGFDASGKPVVSTFKPELHVSKSPLIYNPHLPLVFGLDPGLGGTAAIFGQQDLLGRLIVLGEVIAEGYGTQRFIEEKLRPYIRRRFPDVDMNNIICAPDPAAFNRSQTDERAVVDVVKRYFSVKGEQNNRLPLRLDAIDHFSSRLVEGKPALLIDENECPILIRALRGGWRFEINTKHDSMKGPVPEKGPYSHPGDSFGYLARYFHRQSEREARWSSAPAKKFSPPKFTNPYHYR